VVSCFFFAARATTLSIAGGKDNIFNVPNPVQEFFNTGLLGALITTIIASIMWQLVASAFPLAFLSTPITYALLRICLALEATGICNGAWVIAGIHKQMAGFQKDEVYVGTAEDRAAGKVLPAAIITGFRSQVGHLTGGAYPAGHDLPIPDEWESRFMDRRANVLSNIKTLHELMKIALSEEERASYLLALSQEVSALDRINKEHGETHSAYARQTSTAEDAEAPTTEIDITSPGGEDDSLVSKSSKDSA
jgi:Silicon transporter